MRTMCPKTRRLYLSKTWKVWRLGLTLGAIAVFVWALAGCNSLPHQTALDVQKALGDLKRARASGGFGGEIFALEEKVDNCVAALVSSTE